jgi:pimeloyl-ACP methyl ester carboxylesterase
MCVWDFLFCKWRQGTYEESPAVLKGKSQTHICLLQCVFAIFILTQKKSLYIMQGTQQTTKYPLALLFISVGLLFMTCIKSKNYDEVDNIDVNGVNIVYQVKGNDRDNPVIVLHGNSGEHDHLSVLVDQLDSAGYLVYALDSRGQGANAPVDEYHYIDMAEDLAEFIDKMNIEKPAIFGWSDGGNIALQMEVLHPGTAGLIITAGANIFPEGVKADFWEEFKKELEKDSIPPLTKMMLLEPQMTAEDMQKIQCPALITIGEFDLIDEDHTRMIAENIPKGKMLIVPGEDHGSFVYKSPKIGKVILEYFKEQKY